MPRVMNVLIIDNYDSFTYNLYHLIEAVMPSNWNLKVKRNDEISLKEIANFDKIVISPGPGLPKEAGITCEAISYYGQYKSILGVCLGHQAIAEVYGGKLVNLEQVLHGVAVNTHFLNPPDSLFNGCSNNFETGRYHSWVVSENDFPECLEVTAKDSNGHIMALKHKTFDVKGVQFHPESIMTPLGKQILDNWVNSSTP
jgi:anthranilate synthase component II